MKRQDNLSDNNSDNPLDRNISRLVKQLDDSGQPGRAFTQSLIDDALRELNHSDADTHQDPGKVMVILSRWEKVAAMIAVVCGAGVGFFVSVLAHVNSLVAGIIMIAMFMNWIIYYGGLLL